MEEADPALLDHLAAAATPATTSIAFTGWTVRVSPQMPFRRTNSVLTSGTAPDDIDRAIPSIEGIYSGHGLTSRFQVSSATDPVGLDRFLDDRGYVVEAPVDVLIGGTVTAEKADRPLVASVQRGTSEAWIDRYAALHADTSAARERLRAYGRLLAPLAENVLTASVTENGEIAALGFGVLDRGWIGIFGMGSAPARRRRGLATRILTGLRLAAARAGADRAYLQVERDNAAALALYRREGFRGAYGYHYRRSP